MALPCTLLISLSELRVLHKKIKKEKSEKWFDFHQFGFD